MSFLNFHPSHDISLSRLRNQHNPSFHMLRRTNLGMNLKLFQTRHISTSLECAEFCTSAKRKGEEQLCTQSRLPKPRCDLTPRKLFILVLQGRSKAQLLSDSPALRSWTQRHYGVFSSTFDSSLFRLGVWVQVSEVLSCPGSS